MPEERPDAKSTIFGLPTLEYVLYMVGACGSVGAWGVACGGWWCVRGVVCGGMCVCVGCACSVCSVIRCDVACVSCILSCG